MQIYEVTSKPSTESYVAKAQTESYVAKAHHTVLDYNGITHRISL